MVEAVMLWNEPNNISHWDFEIDPGWKTFGEMVKPASAAIAAERPDLPRVLGGMSPIDPNFVRTWRPRASSTPSTSSRVHGFPLDWNHWQIDEWPDKLAEIRQCHAVAAVGVRGGRLDLWRGGGPGVRAAAHRRTARRGGSSACTGTACIDLPRAWPATTRHREAEGSSYYRHFYMGLLREDGSPKLALRHFSALTPALGICQWFHFEDHRLDSRGAAG